MTPCRGGIVFRYSRRRAAARNVRKICFPSFLYLLSHDLFDVGRNWGVGKLSTTTTGRILLTDGVTRAMKSSRATGAAETKCING